MKLKLLAMGLAVALTFSGLTLSTFFSSSVPAFADDIVLSSDASASIAIGEDTAVSGGVIRLASGTTDADIEVVPATSATVTRVLIDDVELIDSEDDPGVYGVTGLSAGSYVVTVDVTAENGIDSETSTFTIAVGSFDASASIAIGEDTAFSGGVIRLASGTTDADIEVVPATSATVTRVLIDDVELIDSEDNPGVYGVTGLSAGSYVVTVDVTAENGIDSETSTFTIAVGSFDASASIAIGEDTAFSGGVIRLASGTTDADIEVVPATSATVTRVLIDDVELIDSEDNPGVYGVTGLSAGSYEVTVDVTAENGIDSETSTFTIEVAEATPVDVIFNSWANVSKTVGDSAFTLTAPTQSGTSVLGTWTYASGTEATATISGSTVTIVAAGTSVITATFTPDDTAAYNVSTTTMTLTVAAAAATPVDVIFNSWANVSKTVGDSAFTLTAPTQSGTSVLGTWTYASGTPATATISGSTVTIVAAGTSVITATFTPTNTAAYNVSTTTMTLTVAAAANTGGNTGGNGGGSGGGTTTPVTPTPVTPAPVTPTPVTPVPVVNTITIDIKAGSTVITQAVKSKLMSVAKLVKTAGTSKNLPVATKGTTVTKAKAQAAALVKALKVFGVNATVKVTGTGSKTKVTVVVAKKK